MQTKRKLTAEEIRKRNRKAMERKRRLAAEFRARGMDSIAYKLEQCGEYEDIVCCASCGHYWWVVHHCDQRCCPVCARRVAVIRSKKIMALAAQARAPKMLTLTMPRWRGPVKAGIDRLRRAILELRKHNALRTCTAGAYTIELVPKPDGWHIHAHCIVDCDYIPIKRLIGAWSACIGVRGAHCRVQGASARSVQRYICKYAAKSGPDELSDADLVEWTRAVSRNRLWATWGKWYGKAAAAALAKEGDYRRGRECPFCGSVHSVFVPCQGRAIYGDAWDSVRRGLGLPSLWERPVVPIPEDSGPPVIELDMIS